MNFKGKVVVITGASSGIGEESAIEFAKREASVVLVSRRKEKLDQVAKKLGIESLVVPCDVSKRSDVDSMSKQVLEKFGGVDILVNNAGFGIYGRVSKLKVEDMESQMATNFFGMIYCTKAFLDGMLLRKSGHIVNVASVAASFGMPGMATYSASKFAMLGFSEGLYHELHGTGVGVTVVSPIMVKTNFFDHESLKSMPRYSPAVLSSKTVAKAVVKAASSRRLEIIVPPIVRGAVWFKQTFPYIVNPIFGSKFRKTLKDSD